MTDMQEASAAQADSPAPHPFIRPLRSGAELQGRSCFFCGHGWGGGVTLADGTVLPYRLFVEIRVQSDDPAVPAALIISQKQEDGRMVTMHRDPASGAAQAITTELLPILCSDCITSSAHQLGMPPASTEVVNAMTEASGRADTLETERDELRRELEELKGALAQTKPLTALLAAEREPEPEPPKKTRKAAA